MLQIPEDKIPSYKKGSHMQDADLLNYEQVRGEMVCHNNLIISTLRAVL